MVRRDVRADDQPRDDIPQHDRLMETLKDHGGDGRDHQHRRERSEEFVSAVHGPK